MRIPTYTARTQRTNDMPGKRFSVRKNAEPFVRAELAKGEVAASLFDTAGEFAIQRREMIAAQQFNEAALKIEEEVANATDELSRSRDYGNVLDGKNLWGQRMDRIRSEIISTVQMPSLQKKLRHEFDLNEITNRFRLKSVIDKKISAAEQLSLNSLSVKTVEKLSNLNVQIKDYEAEIVSLVNKYAPGVKSGRFNEETVKSEFGVIKKDIAENVVAQYVGRDPNRAIDLFYALEDFYDDKTEDLQELQAGGDYTMHTLMSISSEDANEILEGALNTAKNFSTAIEQREKKQEEAYNRGIESVKSRYEYYTNAADKSRAFSKNNLSPAELEVPAIKSFFVRTPDGVLFADEIRSEIVSFLYKNEEVDNTFQKTLDDDAKVRTPGDKTDKQTFLDLMKLHERGVLSYKDIRSKENLLTMSDYTKLSGYVAARIQREQAAAAGNETDAQTAINSAYDTADDLAKAKYKYNAMSANDDDLSITNEAAYFYVRQQLEQFKLDALNKGEQVTVQDIVKKYQEAVAENEEKYLADVRSNFEIFQFGRGEVRNIIDAGYTFVATKEMLNDFDAWLKNPLNQTEKVKAAAPLIRARLRQFLETGAFK